jgi:hypothetical protein
VIFIKLNALTPSCSIDTFVLKYMKYIKNSKNYAARVEVRRMIDKRTMSLEVQLILPMFVVVSISAQTNRFSTASRFVPIYLHWVMSKIYRSKTVRFLILKKPCVKLGRIN